MIRGRLVFAVLGMVAVGGLLAAPAVGMDKGHWLVRVRGVNFNPDDGAADPNEGSEPRIVFDQEVTWEADLSYFISPRFSLEMSVMDPRLDVEGRGTLAGPGDLTRVRMLAPTLSCRYHFLPSKWVRPYVGVGASYAHFHDQEPLARPADVGDGPTRLSIEETWSYVGQAGVDLFIGDHWTFNWDVKYLEMDTDAVFRTPGAASVSTDISVDPWVAGAGVGFRF